MDKYIKTNNICYILNMPNDCSNRITITCEDREFTKELNDLIINELKHKENDKHVYHETVEMLVRGTRGIIFNKWSPWNPNWEWLESLVDKYPHCWIKNEWGEEGGLAGVWIGFNRDGEKKIDALTWLDICLEGRQYFFELEDEAERKIEEEEKKSREEERLKKNSDTLDTLQS